mgnify:CR=1 FL=1
MKTVFAEKTSLINHLFIYLSALTIVIYTSGNLFAESSMDFADPYPISNQISVNPKFDIEAVWRKLGIPSSLDTAYRKLGMDEPETVLFDSCKKCSSELKPIKWNNSSEEMVILKICEVSGNCRFLLFSKKTDKTADGTKWRFIGHADHDFERYYTPSCRAVTSGKTRYLVMKAQGMTGTGVSLDFERWYIVTGTGMKEILTLPSKGHECTDAVSLCRKFSARVLPVEAAKAELKVTYNVEYSGSSYLLDRKSYREIKLFRKQQKAVYMADNDYKLAETESDITIPEIRTIFSIGNMDCKNFIMFNRPEIKKLSKSTRKLAKQWLNRYIADCESTKE